MSVPGLIGAYMSHIALVLVKRGSMCMSLAPFSRAIIGCLKPTGCASAMFEPCINMQSAFCRSCKDVVAPPLPYVMPRPGTVALCHIRAWLVIRTKPIEWKSLVMR
jgi:hypothetical protein